ncbi:MAG TPA: DNA alkylation repair protein [Puia sp.]
MTGLLKDLYSPAFYRNISDALSEVLPSFSKQKFLEQIFTGDFSRKELKARMRHTSKVLHGFMPANYKKTVEIIKNLIYRLKKMGIGEDGLTYMFLPDYIEVYGIDHFDDSIKALESITQFVSCEFAVRPFLLMYGSKMMGQMQLWSKHENYKVRRLSSEGSRPRLPWAVAIPALKKDPSSILPIMENLKNDPSEWVRRSVANNLNDIAKDHPDFVIGLARKWKGISKETDAIVKHGSRTLLKKGHVEILSHYGLKSKNIHVSVFRIDTPSVKIGDYLVFSFRVTNQDRKKQTVRLEYGLYYKKANYQFTRKVFKISEKIYEPEARIDVQRKQSFKKITTRTFYPGKHKLAIIVNGEEKDVRTFIVKAL